MPERIPELDRMASEAREVDMLPPSEIRRLGDRRRRTRTVAIAGVTAALIAVVGIGVAQSGLLNAVNPPNMVASPSPSDPVSPAPTEQESPAPTQSETPSEPDTGNPPVSTVVPPTWDNVPTPEMFAQPDYFLETKGQYEGPGQAAKGLCDDGEFGSPNTHLTREIGNEGDYPAHIVTTVLGYDSADEAGAVFDRMRDTAGNCATLMEERSGLEDPVVHDETERVPFDTTGIDVEPSRMAYVSYAGLLADSQDGLFGDTLLVQAGERLLWITTTTQGMDHNCVPWPDDEDAMQCEVPAALPAALNALVQGR